MPFSIHILNVLELGSRSGALHCSSERGTAVFLWACGDRWPLGWGGFLQGRFKCYGSDRTVECPRVAPTSLMPPSANGSWYSWLLSTRHILKLRQSFLSLCAPCISSFVFLALIVTFVSVRQRQYHYFFWDGHVKRPCQRSNLIYSMKWRQLGSEGPPLIMTSDNHVNVK